MELRYEYDADNDGYFIFLIDSICTAHFHRNWEILYVADGEYDVSINGNNRRLEKDNVAVVSSFDIHTFSFHNNSRTYCVVLGMNYLSDFLAKYPDLVFDNFLLDKAANEKVLPIFLLMKEENENETLSDIKIKGYINVLLGTLAQVYPMLPKEKNKSGTLILEILKFLNDNFREDISLETVCKKFNYNRFYISNVFSKYIRIDMRAYLNSLRLEYAKKQIEKIKSKGEKCNILRIALDSGFSTVRSYYRAKQVLGLGQKTQMKIK